MVPGSFTDHHIHHVWAIHVQASMGCWSIAVRLRAFCSIAITTHLQFRVKRGTFRVTFLTQQKNVFQKEQGWLRLRKTDIELDSVFHGRLSKPQGWEATLRFILVTKVSGFARQSHCLSPWFSHLPRRFPCFLFPPFLRRRFCPLGRRFLRCLAKSRPAQTPAEMYDWHEIANSWNIP